MVAFGGFDCLCFVKGCSVCEASGSEALDTSCTSFKLYSRKEVVPSHTALLENDILNF